MHKRFAAVLLAIACLFSSFSAAALADTYPYFKITGGDIFAGGWIDSATSGCSSSSGQYQAPPSRPWPPHGNSQYLGGILTYATTNRRGSQTDFGAFAMGLIEANTKSNFGFYSGTGATMSGLSFANQSGRGSAYQNYAGGYFGGPSGQTHCIPDYYDTKQNTNPAPTSEGVLSSLPISSLGSGQYKVTTSGASINIAPNPQTIPPNRNTTLFVDGNVYIGNRISYANGYNATNIPKLTVVVQGNIFIDPSVNQLDGLYIAQPDMSSSKSQQTDGVIWTCHDASNTSPDGFYLLNKCNTSLTVNGAFIAKQFELLRTKGDIGNSDVAETFIYGPEMIMNGAFFSQSNSSSAKIDSLISLPPVY